MKHVDDWLDEPSTNEADVYAKKCLSVARLPAIDRWNLPKAEQTPPLFCTYENKRYRCTGASRMGDVWLTKDFKQETGYQIRVDLDNCTDWSATP